MRSEAWASIGVELALLAEAGRSFYASLTGDARPTPELAARAFALLHFCLSK